MLIEHSVYNAENNNAMFILLSEQVQDPNKNVITTNKRRKETFRRSGIGRIEKARIRTLKMTVVIGKYSIKLLYANHKYVGLLKL